MAEKAYRLKKLGLVWRNRKKISQIINAYLYLPFFLLIILWCEVSGCIGHGAKNKPNLPRELGEGRTNITLAKLLRYIKSKLMFTKAYPPANADSSIVTCLTFFCKLQRDMSIFMYKYSKYNEDFLQPYLIGLEVV
jgi:hypothetical protein